MAILGEIGRTGLDEWSGTIRAEFLRELQGDRAYRVYNEMRQNSPAIAALLSAIEIPLRSLDWTFASDEENDPRVDLLNEARDNLSHSWNDHIIEALTMLPFGFSLFEEVYERAGGKLLWRKFAIRGQDTVHRWLFDENGGLAGFEQATPRRPRPVPVPIEKLLLYRTRVERNNPEGRSILRSAYISYYFAKNIQQIEGIGIERDLAGLPVITLPENADTTESTSSDSDYGRAHQIVRNIRNDEQAGVVLPNGWELALLSTGGQRQFDTDKIVRRYESRMLMSALAQFLVLGQDNVGSLALSKDQTDFFTLSLNSVADIIAETFTKYAVQRLLRYNGMDKDGVRLEHSPAGDVDLSAMSDFLQKIEPFVTWTPEDEVWLRQVGKLPDRTVDEIQQVKEERRARLPQFFPNQQGQNQLPNQNQPPNQQGQQMTTYASNRSPDDDERRRFERRWQRALRGFFEDQQKRIQKAIKGLRR